jgi:transcription antitermination factor NusG
MIESIIDTVSSNAKSNPDDWYAVYTRHQHESTVAQRLSGSCIEAFLPTYNVIRQWKDRKKHLSLPLFPCYVFVRSDPKQYLQVILTPGVHFIVTMAGRPARITDKEIDAIRRAVESQLEVEPHPFLRCGDRVRVKSGPLCDVEGILIRRKGSYRLVLSAEVLEKSVAVEVDAFSVEPIQPQVSPSLRSAQSSNRASRLTS